MKNNEQHLSLATIKEIADKLVEYHPDDIAFSPDFLPTSNINDVFHLQQCQMCSVRLKKALAFMKLRNAFFSDPAHYLEQFELFKHKKIIEYKKRLIPAINDFLNSSYFKTEKVDIKKIMLQERISQLIDQFQEDEAKLSFFLTIKPDFTWIFEHEENKLSGKIKLKEYEGIESEYSMVTLLISCEEGEDVLQGDYELSPPVATLIPKDKNKEPMISAPDYLVNNFWWKHTFNNVTPGVYVILFEASDSIMRQLDIDVKVHL